MDCGFAVHFSLLSIFLDFSRLKIRKKKKNLKTVFPRHTSPHWPALSAEVMGLLAVSVNLETGKKHGTYLISNCPHGFFLERFSRSLPYFSSIDALKGTEERALSLSQADS